jgi:signal transduction histidine kinase
VRAEPSTDRETKAAPVLGSRTSLGLSSLLDKTPAMTLAVTSGVVLLLLTILTFELVMPPRVSINPFVFVPVLAAAWLLPARLAWPVVAIASAIRVIGLLEGPTNPLTVSAEVMMLITIGGVTMFAADRFRTWQAAEANLVKLTARNAAAAEQERIALQLTEDLSRNLFAVTLDLQSAMELAETEPARRRIATAQSRLDAQIADLRNVVFTRSADPAIDPGSPHRL